MFCFMPFVTRIKELIHEGCVGDILSVHFEWMLDTEHGADYFRRWHRKKRIPAAFWYTRPPTILIWSIG